MTVGIRELNWGRLCYVNSPCSIHRRETGPYGTQSHTEKRGNVLRAQFLTP
jgi:hypothetical protein